MSGGDGDNLRITLYCREGTSDKVYQAEVVKQRSGYVVNVAYGRRGGTLTKGTKTPKPLTHAKADRVFADLVVEKLSKGYSHLPPDAGAGTARSAKPKDPTWEHPELGRFKFDAPDWVRKVKTPSFAPFRYGGRSSSCVLAFDAQEETNLPSREAVAVARRVLKNEAKLATTALRAMWDDICGRGPDSGMYWHGDLEQLVEGLETYDDDPKPPKKAEDLLKLMSLDRITIRDDVYRYKGPVAELQSGAAFEEEHGVSMLTDGTSIVGIGYNLDVTPFKKSRPKR